MSIFPDLPPPLGVPDITVEGGNFAPVLPAETAVDGTAARRPGDPATAPADDGEPLFSTDPLR